MSDTKYYRGGTSLVARPFEVRLDRKTGQVLTTRGISVSSRPDGLDRFGGAYLVTQLPAELRIVQFGSNQDHYEIVPVSPMAFDEYQRLLNQIILVRA